LITSKEETENNLSSTIRFQENAIYYVLINENKDEDKKESKSKNSEFELELSCYGSPPHVLIPYKGLKNGWTINFANMLFYGNLFIFEKNNIEQKIKIPIFIFPRKLEVNETIKIIEEILEFHTNLILNYSKITGITLLPGEIGKRNPIQMIKLIQSIWERSHLNQILQNIMDNPYKILLPEEKLRNIEDAQIISSLRIIDMITSEACLKRVANGGHINTGMEQFQFTKAYNEEVQISYDTYPNRFVKFFLKFMHLLLNNCLNELKIQDEGKGTNFETFLKKLINEGNEMKKNTLRFLSKDFFNEVSDLRYLTQPPQVLLKEERYKTVFKAYLDLISGVVADDRLEELLKDPIRDMPELYEYWCFLKIAELVTNENGEIEIKFKPGKEKTDIEKWQIKNKNFSLVYQKNISNKNNEKLYSYTLPLKPDIFLESNNKLYLFDAKYRVDFIEEIKDFPDEKTDEWKREEKRGTYKLADLYKMHTYREAIKKGKEDGKPIWVIALYPGNKIALYSENGKSIDIELNNIEPKRVDEELEKLSPGGVGAIPFSPRLFDDNKDSIIDRILKKMLSL